MMMKTALALVLALGFAAPALAADKCSVPKAEWKTETDLTDLLKKDGWTIKKVKIDNGCYEVYGLDKDGKKREEYFNPKTLEMLSASKEKSKTEEKKTEDKPKTEEKKPEIAKK